LAEAVVIILLFSTLPSPLEPGEICPNEINAKKNIDDIKVSRI